MQFKHYHFALIMIILSTRTEMNYVFNQQNHIIDFITSGHHYKKIQSSGIFATLRISEEIEGIRLYL